MACLPYMFHVYLSLVHELNQTLDVGEGDVLHDDDGIAVAAVVRQQRVEEGAAGAEDDAMGAQQLTFACQGHIAEATAVQQL